MPTSPAIAPDEARRRDLLLTSVMIGLVLTPAWLTPTWFGRPWLLATLLLAGPAWWWSWRHAPWVPTPAHDLPAILEALALGPGEVFCDLGAGDGRMLTRVHAATGATCWGIEAAPLLYLLARLRLAWARDPGVTVRFGDLYTADLAGVDVVYVWGTAYSVGAERFAAFLSEALPSNARVVSYHTPIHGWTPSRTVRTGQRPVHVYLPEERAPR